MKSPGRIVGLNLEINGFVAPLSKNVKNVQKQRSSEPSPSKPWVNNEILDECRSPALGDRNDGSDTVVGRKDKIGVVLAVAREPRPPFIKRSDRSSAVRICQFEERMYLGGIAL